ncbi:Neutral/alkaline non-lysosomal ceramidase [Maioricimonas rarisocia]|uniref:Neutral/alkaline non-lysosomal ceramidase n=1 Tax=Maioricimonas rarisocia TaxID=2528026 RepID=A0A517Z3F7_9PLAN|nr:neutral/alkaline non-lysosomal ceramidase N-terminal domain-containing protein [Maioricimonas rarisocia]QDU37013.1 Neutral/alkaline non-lysosomal ceramidase [Maioricimonas rarisocia]
MFRSVLPICVTVLLLFAGSGQRPLAGAEPFLAGAATADLTPEAGVSMDGMISKPGPVRGVHDPLTSRAIVLALGESKVAICVNDMCMIDREVYDAARQIVFERTGIPPGHQLMAATHSHATPRVVRVSTRPPDEAYRGFAAKRIAEAIVKAHGNLAPAQIAFGTFEKGELLACRRFLCEEGSVAPNPFGEEGERVKSVAGRSTNIIRPAGPIDPVFSVLSIQRVDGRPLAVLGNFSVHYCGGYAAGQVSADYFGVYARKLEEALGRTEEGPAFVGIMSNGTSGDTGSFQLSGGRKPPWERMEQAGTLLAEETLELLKSLEYSQPRTLTVATSELELDVRKPDAERLTWAKELLADPDAKGPHRWSRIYADQAVRLAEYPDRYPVFLQAIRIGDVGIAACPSEVFAETGLAIRAGSPLKKTFTMELANGYSGYLPTPQQHAWGGYETWPACSSHLEVQAEPRIRSELIRLLGEVAQP